MVLSETVWYQIPSSLGLGGGKEEMQMESIYYVMTWLCHRTCAHCYEERFHPYAGGELERVVGESRGNFRRVIANLPRRMRYRDLAAPDGTGGFEEKTGSVILAGGEVLLEAVRESVLYPAVRMLVDKYRDEGGVKVIVQTTGDLLTEKIARELGELGVWMISVSGIDAFHAGLETEAAREALQKKCTGVLEHCGYEMFSPVAEKARGAADGGRYYQFFGATPDLWIGKLWPRGRAWTNGLSTATVVDNFCNQWSGGLNFLEYGYSGSEVSIDPAGDVFPCCVKTKRPVGNVMERPLEEILDRLRGNPVYEAISMGHPERMGVARGWTVEKFLEKSTVRRADGTVYQNLCLGCDAFHEEELGGLVQIGGGVG